MVSWVTAGVLWVSGNDALAPKPCLNPESSFEEGFIRSNAAVQTSVMVWYLYIHIYMYSYINIYIHINMHTHTCIYTHTDKHTNTYIYIYIYIYIYTHICAVMVIIRVNRHGNPSSNPRWANLWSHIVHLLFPLPSRLGL